MNILYVSSLCSDKKFKDIFESSKNKPSQQAQKFHKLLSTGLMEKSHSIYIMSRPPISKSKKDKEVLVKIGGKTVTYKYLPVVRNPVIKHIHLFINGLINSLSWNFKYRKQERLIICDVLNLSVSVSALLISKLCRVKSVAIVTDIPNYMQSYTTIKKNPIQRLFSDLYTKFCNYFMYKYDYYIILTEQMNKVVNPRNKTSIVIEGIVDMDMEKKTNSLESKYKERIIIYAGALYEMYGVKKLIKAFMKLKMDDARLWIYGNGELVNQIKEFQKQDNRIKYFGVQPNEIVVNEQLKATLLVNPRPSNEEFTKYSFPSKNMEYMASGTPVLTTKLQGMPKEYNDYVYLFEDETIEGIKKTFEKILSKSKSELHLKGSKSKEFVLKEKDSVKQARRVLEMVNKH